MSSYFAEATSEVARLHALLLGLSPEERQPVIASLTSGQKEALTQYIRRMENSIRSSSTSNSSAARPEALPNSERRAAVWDTSDDSLPTSPIHAADDAKMEVLKAVRLRLLSNARERADARSVPESMDVQQTPEPEIATLEEGLDEGLSELQKELAELRLETARKLEQLKELRSLQQARRPFTDDDSDCVSDMTSDHEGPADSPWRDECHEPQNLSEPSWSESSPSTARSRGLHEASGMSGRTLEAVMRYLNMVGPEERREAIAGLSHERFLELINHMSVSETPMWPSDGVSDASSWKEEDAEQLEDDEEESEGDGATSSEGEEDDDDDDDACVLRSHVSLQEDDKVHQSLKDPLTWVLCIAQHPAAARRNTQPLGQLQVGGCDNWSALTYHPKGLVDSRVTIQQSTTGSGLREAAFRVNKLVDSGLDGASIRDWLEGRISQGLCHAQLLESASRGRFAQKSSTVQREVSRTLQLYGAKGAALGGVLGALVGGLAALVPPESKQLTRRACGSLEAKGLLDHSGPLHKAVDDAAAAFIAHDESVTSNGALDAESLNFAFQRLCLQVHPQRKQGDLVTFLQAHCNLELLRQAAELVSESGSLGSRAESRNGAHLELARSDTEAAKAAADLSSDELSSWNNRISRHLLDLAWVKGELQVMLESLRSEGAYEILGISSSASTAEVTRAYKAAAMRLHPDKGGDPEQFKALRCAYDRIMASRPKGPDEAAADTPDASSASSGSTEKPSSSKTETEAGAEAEASPDSAEKTAEESTPPEPEAPAAAHEAGTEGIEEEKTEEAQESRRPPTAEQKETGTESDEDEEESQAEPSPTYRSSRAASSQPEKQQKRGEPADFASIIDLIPVEMVSQQAEHAVLGAEMCLQVARMAEVAASLPPSTRSWEQLFECKSQLLHSARFVIEAAGIVSQLAASTPNELMPLLELVKTSSKLCPAALSAVREVMRCSEAVHERSLLVSTLMNRLLLSLKSLAEMPDVQGLSDFVRLSMADTLRAIASSARDVADAAASAAVTVGEAQRHAQELLSHFQDQTRPAKAKEKKEDGKEEEDGDGSDSEQEGPETPEQQRVSNRRLLLKLNRELLDLQREVRALVDANPHLLPEVTVKQKEGVFAWVVELLEQRTLALQTPPDPSTEDRLEAFESGFSLVQSAADWDTVASPGFEARVFRAAALVDSRLLAELLKLHLLEKCFGQEAQPEKEEPKERLEALLGCLCKNSSGTL